MVRKPHSPLSQIIRRVSEMDSTCAETITEKQKTLAKGQHREGPVPHLMDTVKQFKYLLIDGVTITTSCSDNCIRINSVVALVQNILLHEGFYYVVYKEYTKKEIFFTYPSDSSDFGILVVSGLSSDLKCARLDSNMRKYIRIPLETRGSFVVFPLLHLD